MSSNVIDVTEANFQTAVVEASKSVPVVVDFWAEWCGPCKTLGPMLEKVATEADGAFTLAKVDVDQNQRVSQAFGIQGIPTVIAFKDGKPADRFTGAIPEAAVRQFISKLLPPPIDPEVMAAERLAEAGDVAGAESKLRGLLQTNPTMVEAALPLALLLIDRGDYDGAFEALNRQPPTAEVRQLMAVARLAVANIDLASPGAALPELLTRVEERGADKDEARLAMLDMFDLLGPEHPLTTEYRRRLANALF
ncbi:MAG: thioredoxin [Actinomycetota bacterium]